MEKLFWYPSIPKLTVTEKIHISDILVICRRQAQSQRQMKIIIMMTPEPYFLFSL